MNLAVSNRWMMQFGDNDHDSISVGLRNVNAYAKHMNSETPVVITGYGATGA